MRWGDAVGWGDAVHFGPHAHIGLSGRRGSAAIALAVAELVSTLHAAGAGAMAALGGPIRSSQLTTALARLVEWPPGEVRYASLDQRRALEAIYATCGIPGCSMPVPKTEIHHVDFGEAMFPTDLPNPLPVCAYHHRIHDEGWQLTLDERRHLTVVRPDGSVSYGGPDRLPPSDATKRRSTARRSGARGSRSGPSGSGSGSGSGDDGDSEHHA